MFIDYEAIVLSPYGLNLAIVCVYIIRIRPGNRKARMTLEHI